jgi:hypothetical protein
MDCRSLVVNNFKIKSSKEYMSIKTLGKDDNTNFGMETYAIDDTTMDGYIEFMFPERPERYIYILEYNKRIDTISEIAYQTIVEKDKLLCNKCFPGKDQYEDEITYKNHSYKINQVFYNSNIIVLNQ